MQIPQCSTGKACERWSGQALERRSSAGCPPEASTRLRVYAALLIHYGCDPLLACRAALVETLTDDPDTAVALQEGRLNAQEAFMTGKVRVEGDMAFLMQIAAVTG